MGVEILQCLEKRRFPYASVRTLASARSAGKQLPLAGTSFTVTGDQLLKGAALNAVQIAERLL